MSNTTDFPYTIRSFRGEDAPACRKLYIEGLIGGIIAPNDTGIDVEDIAAAYMAKPGSHFWVAVDTADQVVGMLGVQQYEGDTAEIRRLRVSKDHRRRGIGSALLETALKFCQEKEYLKITLDTYMDREPALKLFEKFRFKPSRSKTVAGKEVFYFYLDLYTRQRRAE